MFVDLFLRICIVALQLRKDESSMCELVNSVRLPRRQPECVLDLVTEWQLDMLMIDMEDDFKWTTKPPKENLKLSFWLLQNLFRLRTESGTLTKFGEFVSYFSFVSMFLDFLLSSFLSTFLAPSGEAPVSNRWRSAENRVAIHLSRNPTTRWRNVVGCSELSRFHCGMR